MRLMETLSRYSVEQGDIIGVDITPTYIRIAQLTKHKEQWILEKIGFKYIAEGEGTKKITDAIDVYAGKLKEIIEASKITTVNAALSIPMTSAIIRVIPLPLMTDEELQSAIATDSLWANTVKLTEDLEKYSIFWQVVDRNPANNTMNLLFVASKKADIETYSYIASRAGLNPVLVDVGCFAIRNALSLLPRESSNVDANVILVLGPQENYLLAVHNDIPFLSEIYLSESDYDLLRYKTPDEASWAGFCDRYASQVRQAIRACETQRGAQKILVSNIKLASPLLNIKALMPMLTQRLDGFGLELFDPTSRLVIPDNLKDKFASEQNASVFASAFGLATRKIDVFGYYKYVTGVENINLLPNREVLRAISRGQFWSTLGLGFVIAVLVLGVAATQWLQGEAKSQLSPQVLEATQLTEQIAALQSDIQLLNSNKRLQQNFLETARSLGVNQRHVFEVVNELIQATPNFVWLSEIHYEGADILVIKGLAADRQSIHIFVERLNQGNAIQRTSLQNIIESDEALSGRGQIGVKSFELLCVLHPKAQVGTLLEVKP